MLTKSQLDKMTKPEVVTYCIKLQTSMHERIVKLENAQSDSGNENIDLLSKLIDKLESEKVVTTHVTKALTRHVHNNSQYLRKESIEVHGVADEVGDGDELESTICNLLSMSGEKVAPP